MTSARTGTLVYEPVCHGEEHVPVNAALLAAVAAAFPGEPAVFMGERSHVECVRRFIDPATSNEVHWEYMPTAERHGQSWAGRLRSELATCRRVMRKGDELGVCRMISSSVSDAGLVALKAMLWLRPSSGVHLAVLHSVLRSLIASRSGRFELFAANPPSLRYIVLGEHIRRSIAASIPELAPKVHAVPHPYVFPRDSALLETPDLQSPVVFGFLGIALPGKGFETFCRLAAGMNAAQARFLLVGGIPSANADRSETAVETPFDILIAPEADYAREAKRLHYSVFPYQREDYEYVASGAILDSLRFAKPCIALRMPLFEQYFEEMGDIGYLCESEDELFRTVRAIIEDPPRERYARQCRNIRERRHIYSPQAISGILAGMMKP